MTTTDHRRSDPDTGHASDHAYRLIREQILAGTREGGDWLREGDLAEQLGVSRTPVREALRRLTAEGLVRHERNRGVQVQAWSAEDLDEIFSLRSVLEPWGCRMAATSATLDLDLLDRLAHDMDDAAQGPAPDVDAVTELNNRFHRLILESTGNSRLTGVIASVVTVPVVWRTFSHYSPESFRRSLGHHHELVAAFRAGDADWAESVMRSHVHSAWSSVSDRAQA